MELRIVHETCYDYATPVMLAQHMAHLRPSDTLPGQRLLSHTLRVTPQPAQQMDSEDAFGNPRHFFALQVPHDKLCVHAETEVHTEAPGALPESPPWETVRAQFTYHAGAPFDAANEFVYASPYVPRHEAFADYARPDFTAGRPLLAACEALTARMHKELTYRSGSTEINTPALTALERREGVCQDFAHILLGCLRSLGLPARYVSGYLLTQVPEGQVRLIGADASHAWVSVYCPGADGGPGAWCDFDPTNNHCGLGRPGEDYVTLALGRDFGDVSPLRGVIQGGGSHTLHVGVTVAPVDDFPTTSVNADDQADR
ncbi:transglutaminase family protein [Hydrogenophaga sp. OTU3427]|uniref:transglutaminase family protein n=1 Tax=Hydrogenophaga sp. OTU3427 TaxID=3043856 RepID=UPI00313BB441